MLDDDSSGGTTDANSFDFTLCRKLSITSVLSHFAFSHSYPGTKTQVENGRPRRIALPYLSFHLLVVDEGACSLSECFREAKGERYKFKIFEFTDYTLHHHPRCKAVYPLASENFDKSDSRGCGLARKSRWAEVDLAAARGLDLTFASFGLDSCYRHSRLMLWDGSFGLLQTVLTLFRFLQIPLIICTGG